MQRRIVIVTLQPVGPRRKTLDEQWLGVHLTAALEGPSDDDKVKAQLLPWSWFGTDLVTIRLTDKPDPDASTYDVTCVRVEARPGLAPTTTRLADALLADLKNYDCAFFRPTVDTPPTTTVPRLQDQLAYMGTLVGNIPQSLDLVYYFQVPPELVGASTLFAAPLIPDRSAAGDSKVSWVPAKGLTLVKGSTPEEFHYEWAYDDHQNKESLQPVVYTQPLTMKRTDRLRYDDEHDLDPKEIGLDFSTYWVQPRQVQPWADHLAFVCRRMTDVVRWIGDFYTWAKKNAAETLTALDAVLRVAPTVFAGTLETPDDSIGALAQLLATDRAKLATYVASYRTATLQSDDSTRRAAWKKIIAASLGADSTLADANHTLSDRLLLGLWHVAMTESATYSPAWRTLDDDDKVRWLVRVAGAPPTQHRRVAVALNLEVMKLDSAPQTAVAETTRLWLTTGYPGRASLASLRELLKSAPHPDASTCWSGTVLDAPWAKYVSAANLDVAELPSATVPDPSAHPHELGFTLQLDLPVLDEDSAQDPWRNLAGVGLLLKDTTESPVAKQVWRYANAGELVLDRVANGSMTAGARPLAGPALVPVRIGFRDGVRYPFLTYNQRSLVATNPLLGALDDVYRWEHHEETGSSSALTAKYHYELASGFDSLLLTPLWYGHDYLARPFMMDLLGGLPTELTDGKPWVAADFKKSLDLDSVQATPAKIQYRRRVPVGHVGVCLGEPAAPRSWPAIPNGVHPLALEVNKIGQATGKPDAQAALGPLLLTLSSPTFHLTITPPTVDIDVYERCIDGKGRYALIKDARKQHLLHARSRASAAVRQGERAPHLEPGEQLTFHDPYVTAVLVLTELWKAGGSEWTFNSIELRTFEPIGTPPQSPFGGTKKPIDIQCAIAGSPGTKTGDCLVPNTDDGDHPCSHVMRVSIYPVVDAAAVDKFIDKLSKMQVIFYRDIVVDEHDAKSQQSKDAEKLVAGAAILSPVRVLLETPTVAMPSGDELWKAVSVKTTGQDSTIESRQIAIELDTTGRERAFGHVTRVELLKQPWRWQGRPLAVYPGDWPQAATLLNNDDTSIGWEATAFATLDDSLDSVSISLRCAVDGSGKPSVTPWADARYDDRAHYVRYGAIAISRYAPLFGNEVVSKQPGTNGGVGWHRAFLPYVGAPAPAPVVRAMVPLTRPWTDDKEGPDAVPPIMVVLAGAAFDACGITEWLEARVAQSAPEPRTKPETTRPEYGPDPILSASPTRAAGAGQVTVEGPFGHTFDVAARQPLFSSSSYLVRAPKAVPWDFARIEVRRVAVREQSPSNDAGWSKSQWIQFLPPSTFGAEWTLSSVDVIDVSGTLSTYELALRRAPGENKPEVAPLANFKWYVLVTECITDFRGDDGHERYATLVDLPTESSLQFALASATSRRKVRLMEVQLSPDVTAPTALELWGRLFQDPTKNDPTDAEARITRISPPLDVPQ